MGSKEWLIEKLAEIPVGIVIGGVHNAGHETLFNLMTTGQATWSWWTFAGGAAQAVTRPLGVLIGSGGRMVFGLPVPAENLLAGALGSVTPSMLNDIARAPAEPLSGGAGTALPESGSTTGGIRPGGPGSGMEKGAAEPPSAESADPAEPLPEPLPAEPLPVERLLVEPLPVERLPVEPPPVEPPAVQLLRAVGITPGPDTAYAIAVRTGFVPTMARRSSTRCTPGRSWPPCRR